MSRKIVSITPYNNEKHILDLRINILEDVVDHFYTVEATKTFSGLDKPMTAKTVVHPKHTVVEIEFPEHLGVWDREHYQRNVILDLDGYNDDDIVLITDLDEIPRPETLAKLVDVFDPDFSYSLEMRIYQYYLNNENVGEGVWYKPKAVSVGRYRSEGFNATNLRMYEQSIAVPNAGWHWTFIGDSEFIKKKITDYAHQEFNNAQTFDNIEQRMADNMDTLGRPYELITRDIDGDEFPDYLKKNKEKYDQYIKR